ncbi:MAG: 2-phospho-L-lactate guanylyltransferase [Ilumatobacteraceae bacterium]
MVAAQFVSAVIIPIKSFEGAKERLASALNATERHKLAMYTASRVVAAAAPISVFIVCDDDEVAHFARQHGAVVVQQQVSGLNNAARAGLDAARDAGFTWGIIAHGDLPLATRFDHLLEESMPKTRIGLVSDQLMDGTNVLVIATDNPFTFHYGPGSFRAHCDEATRRGYELRIIDDPALAVDIDTPADLVHLPANWQLTPL